VRSVNRRTHLRVIMIVIQKKQKIIRCLVSVFLIAYSSIIIADTSKIPPYPNEAGPQSFSSATIEKFRKSYPGSVIHAFAGNEIFQASRLQRSFFTKKIQPFFGDFFIGNYTSIDISFNLYFLVDNRLCDFSISKKERVRSSTHNITVKSNSEIILPILLGDIPPGAHDILIVAVQDRRGKTNSRPRLLTHRANLYVKNGGFKDATFRKLNNGMKSSKSNITLNRERDNNAITPLAVLSQTEHDKYFVHVNNAYLIATKYSLIVLLNSKQVPIINRENSNILYFEQQALSSNVIPIEVNTSDVKPASLHNEMLVLIIDNPYTVLEPKRSEYSSVKAGVRVSNALVN